jgi:hypothetical protein
MSILDYINPFTVLSSAASTVSYYIWSSADSERLAQVMPEESIVSEAKENLKGEGTITRTLKDGTIVNENIYIHTNVVDRLGDNLEGSSTSCNITPDEYKKLSKVMPSVEVVLQAKEKLAEIKVVEIINAYDEKETEHIYQEKVVNLPAESVNVSKVVTITEEQRARIRADMNRLKGVPISVSEILKSKSVLKHIIAQQKQTPPPDAEFADSSFASHFLARQKLLQLAEESKNEDDEYWE